MRAKPATFVTIGPCGIRCIADKNAETSTNSKRNWVVFWILDVCTIRHQMMTSLFTSEHRIEAALAPLLYVRRWSGNKTGWIFFPLSVKQHSSRPCNFFLFSPNCGSRQCLCMGCPSLQSWAVAGLGKPPWLGHGRKYVNKWCLK